MLMKLSEFLDGKKTYIFTFAWLTYKLAVAKGYFNANQGVEAFLIAGGAASLRNALTK